MIKINFRKFIIDRQWFGWYHIGWNVKANSPTILSLRNSVWARATTNRWKIIPSLTPAWQLRAKTLAGEEIVRGQWELEMNSEVVVKVRAGDI